MNRKKILITIGFVMLLTALIFLSVALTHPELGTAFNICGIHFGASAWRICYLIYIAVVICLFISAFLIKDKKSK